MTACGKKVDIRAIFDVLKIFLSGIFYFCDC
jgi:hypothetical protein